jgi:hypothetical protein
MRKRRIAGLALVLGLSGIAGGTAYGGRQYRPHKL